LALYNIYLFYNYSNDATAIASYEPITVIVCLGCATELNTGIKDSHFSFVKQHTLYNYPMNYFNWTYRV